MNDEIKERPDEPGLWQRRNGASGRICLAYQSEGNVLMLVSMCGYCRPAREVNARWRCIIDASGTLVCDPSSPWPPEKTVERRRVVAQYCRALSSEWNGGLVRMHYLPANEATEYPDIQLDEIRDCEIVDEKVVRVLPINHEQ